MSEGTQSTMSKHPQAPVRDGGPAGVAVSPTVSGRAAVETSTLITGADGWRRSPSRFGSWRPYKEWQHFLLHADERHGLRTGSGELELIVNFNLIDDVWSRRAGVETARLILLAKTSPGGGGGSGLEPRWTGVTRRFPENQVAVRSGGIDADFGANRLRWNGTAYEVEVDLPEEGIEAHLEFCPEVVPGLAINQPLAPDVRLSWFFVPRLLVSGSVRIGKRYYELERALAYHDHNWAVFRWGDDFTWEWASILPSHPSNPWSFVLMRLTDRARTVVRSQALFVWHRERRVRTFRDREIEVSLRGRLPIERPFQTPPVMGLLTTGRVVDVPRAWGLRASEGDDLVEIDFDAQDVSQVVMPGETDLQRVAVLNEVTGPVHAGGRCAGHEVDFSGRGVFEFLRT